MGLVDHIKVDLYGQYNSDTTHVFTYPEKITNQYNYTEGTKWAAAITDPRAMFQSVCKNGPCYMVYRHKNGYYYSLIERNASDSRGGLEMLTVFVPNGYYATGNSILVALLDLRNVLIKNRVYDNNHVRQCLEHISAGTPSNLFPVKTEQSNNPQPAAAFRSYKNDSELNELFSFLNQKEYSKIDKLLFVREDDLKESASVLRILTPIKRVFTIIPSTNVKSDKSQVSIGDSFQIIYSKEDCEPQVRNVRFDATPVSFYKIEGNKLILVGPELLGVSFNKMLFINLVASDGKPVASKYADVVFDGKVANRSEDGRIFVLVHEDLIYEGSMVCLSANVPHYEPYQKNIHVGKLRNRYAFTVELTPKQTIVPIAFRFGDYWKGDSMYLDAVDVPMEETDPILEKLYNEFSFFGYEASRLPNGAFRVEIPSGRHSRKKDTPDKHKRINWLKIILLSLGGILVALMLILGGYLLRNYDVIRIPGLYSQKSVSQSMAPDASQSSTYDMGNESSNSSEDETVIE